MSFSICLLQSIVFLDLFAVGLIVPLVPNHVRQLGGSHILVGLLGSIYAIFQLGSGPFIGSLSDLKGRKMILIITLFMCSIAYTVTGIANSITVILLMRAVLGLFKQTQMLSRSLVPDYEENEQQQSVIYGRMAAISGIGITLGPVIGGHIVEDYPDGFTIVAIAVGTCFIANAGLVYFLPRIENQLIDYHRKTVHRVPSNIRPSKNIIHSIALTIKQAVIEMYNVEWSTYWDIFLYKALVGFAMGVYYSNYSLYLRSQFELSPKYIGYVISFQGTVGSLSSFFMGYINRFYVHDEDYSIRNLHVFMLLSMSLIGLILSFNIYFYVVWLIPLAIGNAIGRLVGLEMIMKRSQGEHRGTLIGASNSVRSLAGVVAPMVAGFIGHYMGLVCVVYASLFSTLLGLFLCYFIPVMKIKVE